MAKTASLLAATLAALCFSFLPAHALINRAWVSGKGTDAAGCGAPTDPCRTFQYVVSNIIAPAGEIDVLDPAGYGAVTIPLALSIVNDGVGTAGVQATSGNAITINAGASDKVTLRGLNIDGLGTASNGIVFNSGGGLTVTDCVIRHFAGGGTTTGNGILIQPTTGSMSFLISNVIASDNGYTGVYFFPASATPSANGEIDHVTAINNGWGIAINSQTTSSGTVAVALSNSVASDNANDGAYTQNGGGSLTVSIDNSNMNHNGRGGLTAENSVKVLLGRSVITSNAIWGAGNGTSPNTFYTYGDNRINENGTDISSNPLSTTFKPQ
jgi:hypothetical protein